MSDVFFCMVVAILSLVLGIFIGTGGEQVSTAKNCEKAGVHRIGDKVYECRLK